MPPMRIVTRRVALTDAPFIFKLSRKKAYADYTTQTFSEKSLNVGNPRGLKEGEDMHDADVAIEDWQTACRNLAELTDAIIKLSAGSYVIETLIEELISVVRCEADAWHEVQQCGFNDRDEANDFCQKFKGLSGTSLAFLFLKQKTR